MGFLTYTNIMYFDTDAATVLTPLLVGQFPALTLEDDGTLTVPDLWEYANRQSYFEHPTPEQVKAHNVAVKTEELAQFVEATATCASQCTYECSDDIYAENGNNYGPTGTTAEIEAQQGCPGAYRVYTFDYAAELS